MFDGLSIKQKRIAIIVMIVITIGILYYIYNKNKDYTEISNEEILVKEANEENVNEAEEMKEEDNDEIIVHIAGEVNVPGIVKLSEGKRIEDAIQAAGGLTKEADISDINLAYVLEDGIKINIPNINDEKKEVIIEDMIDNVTESKGRSDGKVNINKASQTELETLQGIGPSLAIKIIEYRNENGKFKSIEDIKNVSGIGDTKYEGIKNSISIK